MRDIFTFCLLFLVLSVPGYCGQAARIELTDGSVINGEITSMSGGTYTVNTPAFGEIRVEAAKISKIDTGNSLSSSSLSNPQNLNQAQINSYGEKILSNQENIAVITDLAKDPKFQELVKDPSLAEAAKSGDTKAMMQSDKFKAILEDPKLKEAVKKIKE